MNNSTLHLARSYARTHAHAAVSPAHLLRALLHNDLGLAAELGARGKDPEYLRDWADVRLEALPRAARPLDEPPLDNRARVVLEAADLVRLKLSLPETGPWCVLAALCRPGAGFSADQLRSLPLTENEVLGFMLQEQQQPSGSSAAPAPDVTPAAGTLKTLHRFCTPKHRLAAENRLDPIVGREREMRQMLEILGRRSKPNVLIVGEPGVGKTALADALAIAIAAGTLPGSLQGATLWELDLGALLAGASYRGEVEERLKNLLADLARVEQAILFIDELHVLLDERSPAAGTANLLKPALARGELTVIGATTEDEYRKYVEKDEAFARRFELLRIGEPDDETAVRMLARLAPRYETHHGLRCTPEVLREAVRLARRYLPDRRLPDSAVDLLDRAFAAVRLARDTTVPTAERLRREFRSLGETLAGAPAEDTERETRWFFSQARDRLSPVLPARLSGRGVQALFAGDPAGAGDGLDRLAEGAAAFHETIDPADLAVVVAQKTGIPVGQLQGGEKERLLNLETALQARVVGQDRALRAVADAVRENRAGLHRAKQPIGSFMLLGPTGTGKTELAKALAARLFDHERALVRFDMSEFKEEHAAARLYGAPPGYVGHEEGGRLVNVIRRQPYAVLLFDEIEKAHPKIFDVFLQILDEGRMTDGLGREGDFSNALILFTSNLEADWIAERHRAGAPVSAAELGDRLTGRFRPEFLARVTELVPFAPIDEVVAARILDLQLAELVRTLGQQQIVLEVGAAARAALAREGFSPTLGARPLQAVIRNRLRRPAARLILEGALAPGSTLRVGNDLQVTAVPPAGAVAETPG